MSEVEKKIEECIAEIEPYRIFAPEIDLAVNALKELEGLVNDLNGEKLEKALRIVSELHNQVQPYAGYIPTTASNLKFVKDWLEKKKP